MGVFIIHKQIESDDNDMKNDDSTTVITPTSESLVLMFYAYPIILNFILK